MRHRCVTNFFLIHEGPSLLCLGGALDQPAFRSAVARRLHGKNGADGEGKYAMQESPASLEQVAFISYCVSPPFIFPSLVCFPDWAAEVDNFGEPPLWPGCYQGWLQSSIMPNRQDVATDALKLLKCIFCPYPIPSITNKP